MQNGRLSYRKTLWVDWPQSSDEIVRAAREKRQKLAKARATRAATKLINLLPKECTDPQLWNLGVARFSGSMKSLREPYDEVLGGKESS